MKSTVRGAGKLGAVSHADLQAALDRFGLGRLTEVDAVELGHSGELLFLSTEQGAWVLRGDPSGFGHLPQERFFTELLAAKTGLQVATPYHLDQSGDIFAWPFSLVPRLEGMQLADQSIWDDLGKGAQAAIARELGRTLSEIHAFDWSISGRYDKEEAAVLPLAMSHGRWIVESLDAARKRMPNLDRHDQHWIDEVISETRASLEVPFRPRLVLLDFHRNNVLAVNKAPGVWRLGLVDLVNSYFGDPERALVRCCRALFSDGPGLEREFVAAYLERSSLRSGHEDRFRAYMLLDALSIWGFAAVYGKWWDEDMDFRTWAAEALDMSIF